MSQAVLNKIISNPINLSINNLGELVAIGDSSKVIVFDPKSNFLPELTSYIPKCLINLTIDLTI